MKAPICPKCNKSCKPSGGIVGKDAKITDWACWECNYHIEDIDYNE